MTPDIFDLDAAVREGLRIIRCEGCGAVLALEEADGQHLRANANARLPPVKGRVALTCGCGRRHDWRPSGKPANSNGTGSLQNGP